MDAGGAYTGYTPPPGGIYHTQDAADILQILKLILCCAPRVEDRCIIFDIVCFDIRIFL